MQRTVRHPFFLLSLVVLIVNDHYLKRAEVLPAQVTGKLSDFAGLFVFHWVVVAAAEYFFRLSHHTKRELSRWVAVFIGLMFAAIKLNDLVAEQVSKVLGKIWVDPSDLVALPMLGLSHFLTTRPKAILMGGGRTRHHLPATMSIGDRLLFVVAALACVATSKVPDRTAIQPVPTGWRVYSPSKETQAQQLLACGTEIFLIPRSEVNNQLKLEMQLQRPAPECVIELEAVELQTQNAVTEGKTKVHYEQTKDHNVQAPKTIEIEVPFDQKRFEEYGHRFATLVLSMKTAHSKHLWKVVLLIESKNCSILGRGDSCGFLTIEDFVICL